MDGTLIQAWASHKSFQPEPIIEDEPAGPGTGAAGEGEGPGRNTERDRRGQKRSNQTHASTTDPHARLARKSDGQSSRLAYAGHVPMENRNALVSGVRLNHATGTAERDAALLDARPGCSGAVRASAPPSDLATDLGFRVGEHARAMRV